jgi:imidazolonepropionase-like amidohydrolase
MDAILPTTATFRPRVTLLDNLGTLEKEKLTDLVILEVDQLENVSNIRKISLVMKDGHVVDREVLPTKGVLPVLRGTPSTSSNKEEKP